MNILLFVHIVIAVLLIIVILLQQTGNDGLSGIGGNNMGVVTARSAANFLTKTTIVLASLFLINALVLANLSGRKTKRESTIETIQNGPKAEETSVPVAK